ncbi:MAG: hypothetical protein AAFQ68_22790, partial [Bacteroidota bacterium]
MARKKATSKPTPFWQRSIQALREAQILLIAGLLALIAILLYVPTTRYEYTFDDDVYTLKNEVIQAGLQRIDDIFGKGTVYGFTGQNFGTYRPITLLSFALEKSKNKPFSPHKSHTINIFLYGLCAFVLMLCLSKMLSGLPWLISALICLLFVVHPVHTEVVANVKGREEILALLFGLTSIWLLFKAEGPKSWLWLTGAGISYSLALLSKENTLPWMLVFPMVLFLFTERSLRQRIGQSVIFIGLALFFYYLRLLIFDPIPPGTGVSDSFINNFVMGADTFGERLATIVRVLGHYLSLLVYPHPLRPDYAYNQVPISNWADPWVYVILSLYVAIALGGGWFLLKRHKAAFGPLFYLITLSIAALSPLLFRNVAALAERFLFTPSLGFCFGLVAGGYWLWQRYRVRKSPIPLYAIVGLMCVAGAIKTSQQLPIWQDNETLFTYTTEVAPNNFRAHLNLAEVFRTRAEATLPQNSQR